MNENIDLTKILKDCPEGTKLYSTIFGEVTFCHIDENDMYPIKVMTGKKCNGKVSANGKHYVEFNGECTLFPSKEQRDWNKFTAPWQKKDKFDPKTLQPFDKVLVRDDSISTWKPDHFGYKANKTFCRCVSSYFMQCIPYNDDTKHLVGTTEEAPVYYRYWEDCTC